MCLNNFIFNNVTFSKLSIGCMFTSPLSILKSIFSFILQHGIHEHYQMIYFYFSIKYSLDCWHSLTIWLPHYMSFLSLCMIKHIGHSCNNSSYECRLWCMPKCMYGISHYVLRHYCFINDDLNSSLEMYWWFNLLELIKGMEDWAQQITL